MSRKLFIGNLNHRATKHDLMQTFEPFGEIISCDVKDKFAFIEYKSSDSLIDAVRRMNQTEFMGRRIIVEESHSSGPIKSGRKDFSRGSFSDSYSKGVKDQDRGHYNRSNYNRSDYNRSNYDRPDNRHSRDSNFSRRPYGEGRGGYGYKNSRDGHYDRGESRGNNDRYNNDHYNNDRYNNDRYNNDRYNNDRYNNRNNDRFNGRNNDHFNDRNGGRFNGRNDRYNDRYNDRNDRYNDRYNDRNDRYNDRYNDRFNGRNNDRYNDRFNDRNNGQYSGRYKPRDNNGRNNDRFNGGYGGRNNDRNRTPTRQTETNHYGSNAQNYKIKVQNLDSSVSWQDLKDFAREQVGASVVRTDVWAKGDDFFGMVEFSDRGDFDYALSNLAGKEFKGKKLEVSKFESPEKENEEPEYSFDKGSITPRASRSMSNPTLPSKTENVGEKDK